MNVGQERISIRQYSIYIKYFFINICKKPFIYTFDKLFEISNFFQYNKQIYKPHKVKEKTIYLSILTISFFLYQISI